MKKLFFALFLMTTVSQAQYSLKYDKLFFESGIGLAVPFSNVTPTGDGSALSLIHFQGGLRYMFNEDIGVLGTLSFDQFKDGKQKNDQKLAGLELCYNLGNGIGLARNTRGEFGLLVHGGVAVGAMSSIYNDSDYIGAIIIGARPYIAVNEKVSFFADLTYKATLEQDVYFNGVGTKYPNPGKLTGNQIGVTFGLNIALGQNRFHADAAY